MLEKLKQQPLIGLALAIAGGYTLAHFAIRLVEHLYFEHPSETVNSLLIVTAVIGSFLAARWLRRKLSAHAWKVTTRAAIATCLLTSVAYFAGVAMYQGKLQARARQDHAAYLEFVQHHPEWKGDEFGWDIQTGRTHIDPIR